MMFPNSYEENHYSLGEEDQFSTYDEIYHLKEAVSSDNHPLSMDKLLMLAYMIGRNHGIKEQRNNELLSTVERLAQQLEQIVDYIQASKWGNHPSQIEEAEALHTLRSGRVVDNKIGL